MGLLLGLCWTFVSGGDSGVGVAGHSEGVRLRELVDRRDLEDLFSGLRWTVVGAGNSGVGVGVVGHSKGATLRALFDRRDLDLNKEGLLVAEVVGVVEREEGMILV